MRSPLLTAFPILNAAEEMPGISKGSAKEETLGRRKSEIAEAVRKPLLTRTCAKRGETDAFFDRY